MLLVVTLQIARNPGVVPDSRGLSRARILRKRCAENDLTKTRAEVRLVNLIVVALVLTTALFAQGPSRAPNSGVLILSQEFGRGRFGRCLMTVWYGQPPLPPSRAELSCNYQNPQFQPATATRLLSAEDVEAVSKFVLASDLYSGGHVGTYSSSSERLEVHRCCGRDDSVVLITGGNLSFSSGPRRELLNLLHSWREPLMVQLLSGDRP
jgi:hypothetical protein